MRYYTQVEDDKPTNRIDYCFKCRIQELYQENSPKFQKLELVHHDMFQAYLTGSSKISVRIPNEMTQVILRGPEVEIRDILKSAKIDFKLRTPTFLVHQYDGETFARDIINGFASKEYDAYTQFSLLRKGMEVCKHSVSGYHTKNKIKLLASADFAVFVCDLMDNENEIDIEKYGDDLMNCALTSTSGFAGLLRRELLELEIEYPYDIICRIAATNAELFNLVMDSFEAVFCHDYELMMERTKDIKINPSRVHPEHRRIGLNLIDILVLVNPDPEIVVSEYTYSLSNEDWKILEMSLKYWLKNVENEADFELIRRHVKCLQGEQTINILNFID